MVSCVPLGAWTVFRRRRNKPWRPYNLYFSKNKDWDTFAMRRNWFFRGMMLLPFGREGSPTRSALHTRTRRAERRRRPPPRAAPCVVRASSHLRGTPVYCTPPPPRASVSEKAISRTLTRQGVPQKYDMQPTWFNGRDDTERGSAHALSQPLAIPRARSLPAASAAQPNTDSLFRSLLFQPSGGLSHKPGGASTSPASLSASLSASACLPTLLPTSESSMQAPSYWLLPCSSPG